MLYIAYTHGNPLGPSLEVNSPGLCCDCVTLDVLPGQSRPSEKDVSSFCFIFLDTGQHYLGKLLTGRPLQPTPLSAPGLLVSPNTGEAGNSHGAQSGSIWVSMWNLHSDLTGWAMLTGCLGRAGNHSISQLPCSSLLSSCGRTAWLLCHREMKCSPRVSDLPSYCCSVLISQLSLSCWDLLQWSSHTARACSH